MCILNPENIIQILIYLLAFPSGEGGAGTATDEEKHLPADFELSSKICKSILLLIHHYRGPPSLLGKALKEFDKSKFEIHYLFNLIYCALGHNAVK